MALGIFKRPYTLRKFSANGEGYAWKDQIVPMNIQPITGKDLLALPEGERRIKRCNVICENTCELQTSDETRGIWGDWIYYRGAWYKCEGADPMDATPIGQTSAQFVIVSGNYPVDLLEPPKPQEEGNGNDSK